MRRMRQTMPCHAKPREDKLSRDVGKPRRNTATGGNKQAITYAHTYIRNYRHIFECMNIGFSSKRAAYSPAR